MSWPRASMAQSRQAHRVPAWQLSILGHAIGQAAVMGSTVIIARLADPRVVGSYHLALSVAFVLVPIVTLRLETVAPSMEQRHSWTTLRFAARVAGAASILIMSGGLAAIVVEYPGGQTAFAAGLLVASQAFGLLDNAALLQRGCYAALAMRNLLAGIFTALAQTVAVILWPTPVALALGFALARVMAVTFTRQFGGNQRRVMHAASEGEDATPRMPEGSVSWRNILSGVVGSAGGQLPVTALGVLWGPIAAGHAGVALRLAGAPASFIGMGLQQSMLGRLSMLRREARPLKPELVRHIWWLSPVSALMVLVLTPFGEFLAVALLGEEWASGGRMVSVIAVPLAVQLIVNPMQAVFPVLRAHNILFVIETTRLGLLVCALAITCLVGAPPLAAIIVWSVGLTAGHLVTLRAAFRVVSVHDAALRKCHRADGTQGLDVRTL
ncbi:lipopolysaccharide biosynthesis protein [Geodermatophilus sp. SYSU D00814]